MSDLINNPESLLAVPCVLFLLWAGSFVGREFGGWYKFAEYYLDIINTKLDDLEK